MKALIMAGGTGGHVFPALAVARRLIAAGWSIHWLGSRGGMEVELVTKNNIAISTLPVSGLRGRGALRLLLAPLNLLRSLFGALRVIRRERPQVVLGFGGFASGPGGVAARLLGLPLLIHEQNAVAGLTNRLLARIAVRTLAAFPDALRQLPRATVIGNPVRDDIRAIAAPAMRYAARKDVALRVLVLGGSLGAQALNTQVPAALALLARGMPVQVRHQTGRNAVDAARAAYVRNHIDAEVLSFIDDMAAAYAWADLVICRAGALTVSEVAAAGVPAIFVPFPHAVDDHQTRNADYLVKAGAARLLPQALLDAPRLAHEVRIMADRNTLRTMAEAARKASFGDAATLIANICAEVCSEVQQ